MFFILLILKNFFINSTKHFIFLEQKLFFKIQKFLNIFFFSENTKNYFLELFSKTTTKHAHSFLIS